MGKQFVFPPLQPGGAYQVQIFPGWTGQVTLATEPAGMTALLPAHGISLAPPIVNGAYTSFSPTQLPGLNQATATSPTYYCGEAVDTSAYYDYPAFGLGIHEDGTVEVIEVGDGAGAVCPPSVVSSLSVTSTITHHCLVLTGALSGQEHDYATTASGSKYVDSLGYAHAKAAPVQVVPLLSPEGYWCGYGSSIEVYATIQATFSSSVTFGIHSDCVKYHANYGDNFYLVGWCFQ